MSLTRHTPVYRGPFEEETVKLDSECFDLSLSSLKVTVQCISTSTPLDGLVTYLITNSIFFGFTCHFVP